MKNIKVPVEAVSKNIEEKRESARDKILSVAVELFYTQGYNKTTTRQIVQKAGILNGSLYYSFDSKEDIFKTVMVNTLKNSLAESERLFVKKDTIQDLITVGVFPVALELYASSISKRAAELLYQAHQSWAVLDEFVHTTMDWVSGHTSIFNPKDNEREFYVNILAVMGGVGNLIGEFANTDNHPDYRESLKLALEIFFAVFKCPASVIDDMVKNICDIIENNDSRIFDEIVCPRADSLIKDTL